MSKNTMTVRQVQKNEDSIPLNDEYKMAMSKRNYNRQYAPIYYMRLHKLMGGLIDEATAKWAPLGTKYLPKCLDIEEDQTVFVIGTLFKEMKYKPSMLEEVTRSHWGAPPPKRNKYVADGEDDGSSELLLEDASGRIKLVGPKVEQFMLVTGAVCAVLGTGGENGRFTVVDIVFPGLPPQIPRQLRPSSPETDKYICVASGLYVGQKKADFRHMVLSDWLTGGLDDPRAAQITRLVLAGNSCAPESEKPVIDSLQRHVDLDVYQPMKTVDRFIAELLPSISVDIMPGPDDPCNLSLPQQPLHLAMFDTSRRFKKSTFRSVSNPHWWSIEEEDSEEGSENTDEGHLRILGTSGQNTNDIYKYLPDGKDDILSIMEHTLKWRHLCPTAPDTLVCYPYGDDDPFILPETPHVYFCGNQKEFATSVVSIEDIQGKPVSVRLLAVPDFDKTGQVVLMNTTTLECEVIQICSEL